MSNSIRIGEHIIKLDTIDSTNSYASRLMRNKTLPNGTVILAESQTAGKGQANNTWRSEPGMNLTFSIVIYPARMYVTNQFYLSMVISNALIDFLKDNGICSQIKWPNDICCNHEKIAGILIENTILVNRIRSSVIGIGLNVNQQSFSEDLKHVTSMFTLTGSVFKLDNAFEALLERIRLWIDQLLEHRYGHIKTCYLSSLQYLNEWRSYVDASGHFEGRMLDIAESGAVMIGRRSGELQYYSFKEIQTGLSYESHKT